MKMITNLMKVMIIMILSTSVVFAQTQNKKDLPVQKVNYSTSDITTQSGIVQSTAIDNIAKKSAVQSTFQQVNGKNTLPTETSAKQIKVLPGSGSTDVILYSQMTPATWGRASQDFEASFDIYDNQAADDFTVTGGPWNINLVKFIGHYSTTGPAAGFNIYFYNDNAGLPGTLITSYPSVGYSVLGDVFSCTLPSTLVLADGTYWISVQVRMDFSPYGQWYWRANALPLIGYEGAWQNPGDGFGSGFTTWTSGGTVWGGTYAERDFCFEFSDEIPLPSIAPSPYCQTVDGLFDAGGNVTYEMYLYAANTYNFSICFEDLCCGGNYVGTGDGDFTMMDAAMTQLWYIDGNSSCNYAASTFNSAYENWAPPADGYYYLQVDDYYGTYAATFTLAYISNGAVPLTVNETCSTEVGSFAAGSGVYYQISMLTTSTYNFSICALDATCPGDYLTGGAGDGDLYLIDNTGAIVFYIDGTSACGWNASTWGTAYESFVPSYDGCYYLLVTDFAGASGTYTLGHIRVGCNVTCPVGGLVEGEAQIPDEGADVTNGGCNMLPSTPLFTPIASGDTYCGQTNTYTTTGGTVFRRDTDWYRFDASSSPATYWNFNITATAEFNLQILLINAGSETCTDYSIVGAVTAGMCEVATLNGDFPSGIYYIWVGPQTATGNPYPYGGGPYEYVMSYTGTQLGVPVATINPPAVEILLAPETTTTTNLTIGNTGTYTLDYTAATSGTTAIVYGDNFDAYAAGVQLAAQSANWTTWSGAPGSTEDPFVSTDVAYNGANSVLITGVNDCVYPMPNYTTGNYKISFRMNIPAGFDGYFNVLQLFAGASSEWGTQVYFDAGGVASIDAGASAAASWAFAYDTWLYNELYVDLDNDYAEFYFDGTFIIGWQWSTGTFGTGTLNQLGGCNFYAYTGTQTPKYYFDDFKLEQVVNDWLTLDGGTATSGSILAGGANIDIVLGFSSIGKTPGATYSKVINFTTNELGAKTSYTIPVTMYVGYELTGNVYYGVTGTTKPMATNTTVTITPGPTASTGPLGAYVLRPLADGTYALTGATTKPWGGLNSFDATLVARYLGSIVTLTNLQKRSADVNLSNSITSFDGTLIKRRLGSIATPQWTAPNFVFDGPFPSTPLLIGMPITISGANATQEFRTICSGDLNSSYTPPAE
jgi:hypothetical protein